MIEGRDITLRFGDKVVFEHFGFRIPDGAVSAVMGVSGSGKTTLLRLLAGLVRPETGRIDGLENRRVAMVFQEDRLLPWLSVLENAAIAAAPQTARAALCELGLAGELESKISDLSGGMRRRVALARALAAEAGLLLLDEPFTGLDEATRETAASAIRKRAETVVLVTHDAREAALLGAKTFIRL